MVLVSHTWPLGFGARNPLLAQTHGQTDLGTLAVYGFFVLSGFLVAASGRRLGGRRFWWHRFLRIFPGLWVCLLVTALVIAPCVTWYEHGSLVGFWSAPDGPLRYLRADWWSGMRQYPISGLLSTVPYARVTGVVGPFNGSLWSLVYEVACYVLAGLLVFTGVLRRAPRVVLVAAAVVYLVIVRDYLVVPGLASQPGPHGRAVLPLVGVVDGHFLLYLGFLFLLGMVAQLYQHRILVHPVLVGLAAAVLVSTLAFGGFFVLGLLAFAYLLLCAAATLPTVLHRVGRTRDYSYGIYIYAFPVQEVVAVLGGAGLGYVGFIGLSLVGTMVLAVGSWHLVERPALALKDLRVPWLSAAVRVER